jgi:hypothetical protein
MAASSTCRGAQAVSNALEKVSLDAQKEILTHETPSGLNLYGKAMLETPPNETCVKSVIEGRYTACGIPADQVKTGARKAIAGQEVVAPPPGGYGLGLMLDRDMLHNNRVRMAQVLNDVLPKNGEQMTQEQVDKFKKWLNGYYRDGEDGNRDIFIKSFAGNEWEREASNALCDAIYAFDSGKTLGKILLDYSGGYTKGGIGGYIKDCCFPDASYNAIMKLYTKCGLHSERTTIDAVSSTGYPLMYGFNNFANDVKFFGVTYDGRRGLTYSVNGGKSTRSFGNVRQLAQAPNLARVTLPADCAQITRDDLVHLFRNAKNLEKALDQYLNERKGQRS